MKLRTMNTKQKSAALNWKKWAKSPFFTIQKSAALNWKKYAEHIFIHKPRSLFTASLLSAALFFAQCANVKGIFTDDNSTAPTKAPDPSCLDAAQPSGFNDGDGASEDTPYLICTQEQLEKINDDITKHYKLGSSIDLSGGSWSPIASGFSGSLDGDGYSISNFSISGSGASRAFFEGTASGSMIRNLGLWNADLTFSSSGTSNIYGAILVGRHSGLISNCYSTGSVSVTTSNAASIPYGSGLVGYNDNGTISSSYSRASVSSTGIGLSIAGGLVGDNGDGTINSSYAAGSVMTSCTRMTGSTASDTGGLAGRNGSGGTINNSYAAGSLSALSSTSGFAIYRTGGLIGSPSVGVSLSNSYWDTSSTGESDACGNAVCAGTTGFTAQTTAQMQAVSGTFPSGLGDGFQFTAGSYPKVKKCTVCTGTLEFSDELVPGQE